MFFITEAIEKRAIVFSGHLYRKQAVTYVNEHGFRDPQPPSMDDITENDELKHARAAMTINRGRGKSKHYEVDVNTHNGDLALRLERSFDGRTDLTVPGTAHVESYNDLYITNDPQFIPDTGAPRFTATRDLPRQTHWVLALDRLRSKSVSMIIIDGYLVWVGASRGGSQAKQVEMEVIGTGQVTKNFVYRPFNEKDDSHDRIITDWGGLLWMVGPAVFATSEEEAMLLRGLLQRHRLVKPSAGTSARNAKIERQVRHSIAVRTAILNSFMETIPEPLTIEAQERLMRKWLAEEGQEYRTDRDIKVYERIVDELVREWIEVRVRPEN